jgi:tetratricopeptide (TPR) repeat protein
MSESAPKDLRYAENLRREGKLLEALKVINDIEKKGTLTPGEKLSLLISKGKIYTLLQNYPESAKIGELTYSLSKELERVPDTIMALIFRSNPVLLGQLEKVLDYLNEAENLLNSLSDVSPNFISRQKANILFRKAWAHFFDGNRDEAIEKALECLDLQEKLGNKNEVAYTLHTIGHIYFFSNEFDLAVDYVSKGLTIFEEIGNPIGSALILNELGTISFGKGDLNKALAYCRKSLSTKPINTLVKYNNYTLLGDIYHAKGELDRALRYYKRILSFAEQLSGTGIIINTKILIGTIYVTKREYELAIDIFKSGLMEAREVNNPIAITNALLGLMMVYYQVDLREELKQCLEQLNEYPEKFKFRVISNGYRIGKAWLLLKSGRSHNRAEAEKLLNQAVQEATNPIIYHYAMSELCEFYLEELHLFNDPEILEELNPLTIQLLNYARERNLYGTLAEAKLLQAKLALIQMKFEEAQQLLTQAQRVAELHGLNHMAQKISSEHDNYLEKLNEWKKLKAKDAPMAERLELASVDGVIERLQGKRAIEPPEIFEETPILLLIMDESGNTLFTHSFSENWDFDDLFSSFMSAFNTFSGEIFSKSIDRIIIDEYKILINPVESFLVCYVIKGQSYPALQKLNRFSDAIKLKTDIWDALNRAVKTGEVLELDNPASLGNVVREIFTQ